MRSYPDCLRKCAELSALAGAAADAATRAELAAMAELWRELAGLAAWQDNHPHRAAA